jgi:hypothetical protein
MISGKPYWYLRQMARVDGKPKMVSERYLGTAADIGLFTMDLVDRLVWLLEGRGGPGSVDAGWSGGRV